MSFKVFLIFIACSFFTKFVEIVHCFPEQGKWTFTAEGVTQKHFGVSKSLYKDSTVTIKVDCDTSSKSLEVKIGWLLRQTPCYEEYVVADTFKEEYLSMYYTCPWVSFNVIHPEVRYLKSKEVTAECLHAIQLLPSEGNFTVRLEGIKNPTPSCGRQIHLADDLKAEQSIAVIENKEMQKPVKNAGHAKSKRDAEGTDIQNANTENQKMKENNKKKSVTVTEVSSSTKGQNVSPDQSSDVDKGNQSTTKITPRVSKTSDHQAKVDKDGMYLFVLFIESVDSKPFNITVNIEMKSQYGYLSAVDWPLLPFYGVMCGIYVIYAIAWLIVTALQWRDLLRIQFWIGGVIFLGLVEKAVLYAKYQSLNESGESVKGAIILAEIISSLKRTLARMLVIIVSLGFGIVKPRLGPLLHRVVCVGVLYFLLSAMEGFIRSLMLKNDPSKQTLIAGVPLAFMDSAICWWIFSSLVQTTRTLQLRRNLVKLSLYKHFTNTLIFAVLASIAYMIWSIHSHKFTSCITDWKELWVDDAYWHLLFSIILLVIMILWRPTNNNQRYAFTPLLDAEDDDDDIKDHTVNNDAYGMKMRGNKSQTNTPVQKDIKNKEDDLKWVEENIPSLTESTLPSFMDSDEEIMTAKFERNKME
ncbi:transmembrane protein 87A isoform X2 [Centruroides vittatus]|uniref:transmembrane protein 87A isoform X2 n=1 Tax=Centruroides vittatus TaxID=120091 RepID=UPI00350F3ADB